MSSGIRVIRFARVVAGQRPDTSGPVVIARVHLDEQPAPAGDIVMHNQVWSYVLPDGKPSGLTSAVSRQDLEHQVLMYHSGSLPATGEGAPSPLKLAM